MIRAIALVAALVASVLWSREGRAQESSFSDLNRITEADRLVVALPAVARPPYVIGVEGQELQGFDPWLARQLATALGVKLKLDRTAETPDDLIDLVAAGDADLALGGILLSVQRAMRVRFSRPYVREAPTFLLNRRNTLPFHSTCPTQAELTELFTDTNHVAVLKGSQSEALVRQLIPDARPRLFDDPREQFEAVVAGDVLLSIHGEAQSRFMLHQRPSARIHVRSCIGGAKSRLVAIAVRPDAPDLLRWVNVSLEAELIDMTAEELLKFGERQGLWP